MPASIALNPQLTSGKSLELEVIQTLPYGITRVAHDCRHSPLYMMRNYSEQPLFCGLCFFRDGFQAELPAQLHQLHTLAENGNPQTTGGFMAHLFLVMGLKGPKPEENLRDWRKKRSQRRTPLARGQFREGYTSPAWQLYPVASSLWKLVGYQPPLGIVLAKAVGGAPEITIAAELETSLFNVNIRMVKGIRTAMRYLPRDSQEPRADQDGTGGDDGTSSEPTRAN